jgi:SMC interacting uncharacterized protein involved in chromosome segregation
MEKGSDSNSDNSDETPQQRLRRIPLRLEALDKARRVKKQRAEERKKARKTPQELTEEVINLKQVKAAEAQQMADIQRQLEQSNLLLQERERFLTMLMDNNKHLTGAVTHLLQPPFSAPTNLCYSHECEEESALPQVK